MAEQPRDWTAFGRRIGQKCAPVAGGFLGIWAVLSHIGINFGPDLVPDFSKPADSSEDVASESDQREPSAQCQIIFGDIKDSTITFDDSFSCETPTVGPKETVLVVPMIVQVEGQPGEAGWTPNVIADWFSGERETLPSPNLSVDLTLQAPNAKPNLLPLIPRTVSEFNFLFEDLNLTPADRRSPKPKADCFNAEILASGSDWCSPESANF